MRTMLSALCLCVLAMGLRAEDAPGVASRNGPPIITSFSYSPDPIKLNQPVTFKLTFTVHNTSDSSGFINFGDGSSQSLPTDSAEYESLVKGTLTHTYTALPTSGDVFLARVSVQHGPFQVFADTIVRVGTTTVVEPVSGVGQTVTDANGDPGVGSRFLGGRADLRVFFTRQSGTSAVTVFEDVAANDTQTGLNVTHTFTHPGIFVATSTGKSGTTDIGKSRKMINISARDTGDSGALADAPDANVVMKKMSGKFAFSDPSKTDKVSFSGEIKLPAGFNPAHEGGNKLIVGIGNIVDEVTVDAKGKATAGTKGNIVKAKVKFPKLTGPAAGGEIATLTLSYAGTGLSSRGFDTEGIKGTLATGEETFKAVGRSIQVDIQFAGVPYEGAAPVEFKRSKKGDAGAIKGLPTRVSTGQ